MLCTVDGEGTITVQTKQKFRGRNVSLHLRKCLLSLMEMFHLLKVLYWYGKNYCNYNTSKRNIFIPTVFCFHSYISFLVWKLFITSGTVLSYSKITILRWEEKVLTGYQLGYCNHRALTIG